MNTLLSARLRERKQRLRKRFAVLAIAGALVAVSAPQMAQAAQSKYANNKLAYELQILSHSGAGVTVKGGTAYGVSSIMDFHISTVAAAGYQLAHAWATGVTVNMTHPAYSNSYSNCWWDYAGGTLPSGSQVTMNCWRTY